MERDSITIDGVGPMPVAGPASAAELCEIVRRAAADKHAIYPVGGGTALDYGLPPARPGLAVSLTALDKVIDFPARDMTITVETGITMARLHAITQAERLHLPIDVPDTEHATLGGAIACNVSGPRRYGYGTFRDYIVGITTVNDRGEEVSAGGRVVKNVAGYDLMKLHTGALGTLGVVTQVTMKLKPMPDREAYVSLKCALTALRVPVDLLLQTKTRPTSIQAAGAGAAVSGCLWIGFDGNSETVAWQIHQLKHEFESYKLEAATEHEGVMPAHFFPEEAKEFYASVPPSKTLDFIDGVGQADKGANVVAQLGSGVVYVRLHSGRNHEQVSQTANAFLAAATESQGNVIVRRCPTPWKKELPVWGRPPVNLALQKAIKRALDPQNLFNPGRFVTDAF